MRDTLMAAESKLTPQTQQIIVDALRAGETLAEAARRSGVTVRSIQFWRKRGGCDIQSCSGSPYAIFEFACATAEKLRRQERRDEFLASMDAKYGKKIA